MGDLLSPNPILIVPSVRFFYLLCDLYRVKSKVPGLADFKSIELSFETVY